MTLRRAIKGGVAAAALTALVPAMLAAPAHAVAPRDDAAAAGTTARHSDDLPSPLSDKQRAMRAKAAEEVVRGNAKVETKNGSKVAKLAPGQYVELAREKTDNIFTILTDFGDKTMYGGEAGPVHGSIPKPDRSEDNSTAWSPTYDRQHYLDMFFGSGEESFADFYEKQSSGRYSVTGDVSDWVTVPYNEARYGDNAHENPNLRRSTDPYGGYWNYIQDTAQAWYDAQKHAGKTDAEIKDYLAQFDQWDRYDYDHDGNFNEPDGYIDHFQAIHAGEGEEAGADPSAIWSHRWYAFSTNIGKTGPADNKLGGVRIGDTGLWIGDYTTEPENGGLGVFAHEFGHDLGLPDEYDTQGGDNGTGFWTLMSAGSWLGHGDGAIGTTPGDLGAWDKLQLGWLDYQTVPYGSADRVKLGLSERNGKAPQAIVVPLPDKNIRTDYNTPASGSFEWWGGSADNLNTTLTRSLAVPAGTTATLSTKAWYKIERDYDYLYAEVSTDGGTTWTQLGSPVTGTSGVAATSDQASEKPAWTSLSFDLSPYAGKTVDFRFRYKTDGGLHYAGPFLDDLKLTVDGAQAWSDDAESGDNGWAAKGWSRMNGFTEKTAKHAYIAENRQYVDYDATLQTGPYNFGRPYTDPAKVEQFPYQNGLLVWYWDGEYSNNNTSQHPGHGLILPVDSFADPITFDTPNGTKLLGNRRQPFDAPFGLERTDAVTFHRQDKVTSDGTTKVVTSEATVPSRQMKASFDDRDPSAYYSTANKQDSVLVAGTGTQITVHSQARGGAQMLVDVTFTK